MHKNISRKGAKTQREITRATTPFAALRLCARIFFICLLACTAALAQNKAARFDPDGSFWLDGDTPNEFPEFGAINLNAKRSRQLPLQGFELRTGKRIPFKTLTVKRDNFTFTTVTVGGISYAFAGKFLKGGVYSAGDLDDQTPVLEGTLTKFRGGQKIAEAKLKLVYFGGT